MNALILLAFLALLLFVGKKLFDVRDWGKHSASIQQAQGRQPQYKGNRVGFFVYCRCPWGCLVSTGTLMHELHAEVSTVGTR